NARRLPLALLVYILMTTSVGNNSVFRSFFKKQKLTGPNFIDWYRQLRLELLQTVREFHTSKQEEGQLVSSHVLKMKGYIENLERLGQPVGQNLAMTTSVGNNSVFRSFFEKQKLNGPNFIDWYRQLRLVLSTEDKENYLEHPIPVAPVAPPRQQVPPQAIAAHPARVKGQKEVATVREFHTYKQAEGQSVSSYVLKIKGYIDNLERLGQPVRKNLAVSLILVSLNKDFDSFVQNYNMHDLGKTVNKLHAILKLHEESLPKKDANPALHAIRAGRVQKNQKNKPHKAAKGGHGKGKGKMGNSSFASKPKTPPPPKKYNPAKDAGASTSGIFTIELYSFPSKSWIYDTGCGTHICIITQGLRGKLPSGLVIILKNCHYAPSITRGVILVSRLFDDGFVNRFDENNVISVSKNNLVYFMAVPRDGIYEIDMTCTNTNDSSMYAITNKRAKINLDSFLLWHCRLGHISKKRIEKLQHDGLLNSIDIESLGKCLSSMSGKMARKPYSHQVERAKDLLGLIHTDVCAPFKIVSRQGASFFVTFTDDFSHYGYVYLLKHKHEVFETFKVFQKEVENQLGKTIKSLHSDREGYPKETIGYSFYNPSENKVFVDRNAEFFESKLLDLKASRSIKDLELIQEEDTNPFVDTGLDHEKDDQEINEPQSDINPIRKSSRTRRAPYRMCLYIDVEEHELGDLGEPANYKAALLDPESKKWLDAMNNMTSRFQQNPGEEHWTAVKNILKYLRNTKDMFLVYGGNMERELRVSCYTDAGYLTDADNLKSQTGYVFVLNGGAVDWKSTKQRAIAIGKDDGVIKGARHFRAKVHYLRETIKLGDVKIEKIYTYDNLANPFTKALAFPKHSELTRNIGLLPASSFMSVYDHFVFYSSSNAGCILLVVYVDDLVITGSDKAGIKKLKSFIVVVAGTNSTNFSGTKEVTGQDVKKDVSSLRYIALLNWFHEAHLVSSTSNAQNACSVDAPESSGNSNPTATSTNLSADLMERLAVETLIPTVSSPVPTACLDDSLQLSSNSSLISKRVTSQDDTPSLDNILTLTNRFEDILGVTTNTDDSNGVEADLGNMEYNISASPIPTFRIHKDHPKSQIIGPVDTLVQTRTKFNEMEEHSFIATIHQKINPTVIQFCLFSCFLSQEPKKISDALQYPSWVEAM
nr:hypothetical protein [Tanacetum cinerariifolium]